MVRVKRILSSLVMVRDLNLYSAERISSAHNIRCLACCVDFLFMEGDYVPLCGVAGGTDAK